jgi:aspartyl-tRNA(Asn)/glutamyl-tRNA(Gln) amidotransferase subunit A
MDHVGPFGRSVADARIMFDAIVDRPGQPSRELTGPPLFAFVEGSLERAAPDVRATIENAARLLEAAGARIEEPRKVDAIEQHLPAFMLTMVGEGSLNFEELLRDSADGISPKIRASLQLGAHLRAADYIRAQQFRTMLRESVARAMKGIDGLLTPCMLRNPWTWKELDELKELIVFGYTAPFSLTGNPALSLPVPSDGLPVGLQLVGRRDRDEDLFDLATWAERALA